MATFRENLNKDLRDIFEANTGIFGEALKSKREKAEKAKKVQAQAERINASTGQLRRTNAALTSTEASFIQISKNIQLIAKAMGAEVTLQEDLDESRKRLDEIAAKRLKLQQEINAKKAKDLSRLNKKVNNVVKEQKQDKSLLDSLFDLLDDLDGRGRRGRGGRGGRGGGRGGPAGGRQPPGSRVPTGAPPTPTPSGGPAGAPPTPTPSGGPGLPAPIPTGIPKTPRLPGPVGLPGPAIPQLPGPSGPAQPPPARPGLPPPRPTPGGAKIPSGIAGAPARPGLPPPRPTPGGAKIPSGIAERIAQQAGNVADATVKSPIGRKILGEAAKKAALAAVKGALRVATGPVGQAVLAAEAAAAARQAIYNIARSETARKALALTPEQAQELLNSKNQQDINAFGGSEYLTRVAGGTEKAQTGGAFVGYKTGKRKAAVSPQITSPTVAASTAGAGRGSYAGYNPPSAQKSPDKQKTDDQGPNVTGSNAPKKVEGPIKAPKNVTIKSKVDLSPGKVKTDLLTRIYAAAEKYGKPVSINSAYRSDAYQAELYVRGHILKEEGIFMPSLPKEPQTITYKGVKYNVPGNGHHNAHLDLAEIDISPGWNNKQWREILASYGVHFPWGPKDPPHTRIMKNAPPLDAVMTEFGIPLTTDTGGFVTAPGPAAVPAPAAAAVSKPSAAATGGGKFFPVDPKEIMAFQKSIGMKGADVDGIIGPKTHRALIAAGYKEQDVGANIRDVVAAMKKIGITDKNYIEALIGNIMKESGGKVINEDIMGWANTDNKRIREFFGKRVAHLSDPQLDEIKRKGKEQGNFVELFTEMIYGIGSGELGAKMENTAPGDGYKYRGRGFIQLTGKKNYRMASQAIYGDDRLVKNPDLVNDPAVAAPIVAWYMKEGKDRMGRALGYTGPLTAEQARILTTSQIAGSDIRNKGAALSTEILGKVAAYQTTLAPQYSQGQTGQGPVTLIVFNNTKTTVKKPGTQVARKEGMALVGA